MTKEEFLQEAALRLITANPAANMADIARWAADLAEWIFPPSEVPEIACGQKIQAALEKMKNADNRDYDK